MRSLVIIPCFNEAKTIRSVLEEVRLYAQGSDILIIDDGSTDEGAYLLSQLKGVEIIFHPQNLGYGRTLIDGFEYAKEKNYDACLTIDCDAQHEPNLIPHFLEELPGWDVVSGSRYLNPPKEPPPTDRYQLNMEITALINDLTGFHLTDSFCGFKAYWVSSLSKIKLTEPGYGMPLQFWIRAAKAGFKVKEIPVPLIYIDRERSFPGRLKSAEERRRYYLEVISKELKNWPNS